MSKNQDDRSSGVACTSRTDGQTDKQTNRQTDKQTNRQTDRQTDRQTAVTNILCKNLRFCKVMKGHSESAYFAKLDLQTEWLTL